jgi:ABC-type transporter Mla MlaB component
MAAAMKTLKRKSKTANKVAEPQAPEAVAVAGEADASVTPSSAAPGLALASHCTIKDAASLKLDLCAMAHEHAEVSIDVGAVERIDTSTMQLLCAFVRDRTQRNQKVLFKGDSQSWREAVRLLGVAGLLGLKRADGEVHA